MICFGTRRHRRIGLHRFALVGRSLAYGHLRFRVRLCIYCDQADAVVES